jgi:hypothetical protein
MAGVSFDIFSILLGLSVKEIFAAEHNHQPEADAAHEDEASDGFPSKGDVEQGHCGHVDRHYDKFQHFQFLFCVVKHDRFALRPDRGRRSKGSGQYGRFYLDLITKLFDGIQIATADGFFASQGSQQLRRVADRINALPTVDILDFYGDFHPTLHENLVTW